MGEEEKKSWFKENQTMIICLIGQLLILGAFLVRLETRVHTLEVRGSPHLEEINRRLTTTEKETQANDRRIEKIVDVMIKNLHMPISPNKEPHK